MEVRISSLSGSLCTLAARGDWQLPDLHEAVKSATGKPAHVQRLFFGTDELVAWRRPLSELLGGASDTFDVTLVIQRAPWCRITGFRFQGVTIVVKQQEVEEAKTQCTFFEVCHCFSLSSKAPGLVDGSCVDVHFEGCISKEALHTSSTWITFLRLDSTEDRNIVFDVIARSGKRHDPLQLQSASDAIRSDREIIVASVTMDGGRLQHASVTLRNDPEVVAAAARNTPTALRYADPALLDDPDFAKSMVKQIGEPSLSYIGPMLLNDLAFALWVVKSNCAFLKHLGYVMRNQEEVVLAAVKRRAHTLQFAGQELLSDRAFVQKAVAANRGALLHVPQALWKDSWQSAGMAGEAVVRFPVAEEKPAVVEAEDAVQKSMPEEATPAQEPPSTIAEHTSRNLSLVINRFPFEQLQEHFVTTLKADIDTSVKSAVGEAVTEAVDALIEEMNKDAENEAKLIGQVEELTQPVKSIREEKPAEPSAEEQPPEPEAVDSSPIEPTAEEASPEEATPAEKAPAEEPPPPVAEEKRAVMEAEDAAEKSVPMPESAIPAEGPAAKETAAEEPPPPVAREKPAMMEAEGVVEKSVPMPGAAAPAEEQPAEETAAEEPQPPVAEEKPSMIEAEYVSEESVPMPKAAPAEEPPPSVAEAKPAVVEAEDGVEKARPCQRRQLQQRTPCCYGAVH